VCLAAFARRMREAIPELDPLRRAAE
jgi:hypothetical protein